MKDEPKGSPKRMTAAKVLRESYAALTKEKIRGIRLSVIFESGEYVLRVWGKTADDRKLAHLAICKHIHAGSIRIVLDK